MTLQNVVNLDTTPVRAGTYSVMRNTATGECRKPEFRAANIDKLPAAVANANRTWGGIWEFLPISSAMYDAIRAALAEKQTPYIDSKIDMVLRVEGTKRTARFQAIQAQQKATYTRRDVRVIQFNRVTDREIKRVA